MELLHTFEDCKMQFQQFIDFFTAAGTLPEKVDIAKYLQTY